MKKKIVSKSHYMLSSRGLNNEDSYSQCCGDCCCLSGAESMEAVADVSSVTERWKIEKPSLQETGKCSQEAKMSLTKKKSEKMTERNPVQRSDLEEGLSKRV